ncbi:MAG: OsmC family peroxiredoxin [Bacteroidetes bacterium]|nr:MAG: OsmC family peroxiredoxin [Bacteroidota bacterium]
MLEYQISATVQQGGQAKATANNSEITFDATSGRHDFLPNPAELLLTSLSACILKNVQRYSEILKIPYRSARIVVQGKRNDSPPFMSEINYQLEIDTDADERKLQIWHKNILKFGTITNTLAKASKLEGTIAKMNIR